MKNKKTTVIVLSILSIGLVVSALFTTTYALFSSDAYGTNLNTYSTGMLSIEASSKSDTISLTNALPMTDEDGVETTPYVFTIKNTGTVNYRFNVKLLSTGTESDTFLPQYIKLQIDDGEVSTLSELNGVIKSDVILNAGDSVDISIRAWLSWETPNTELGKSFNSQIVTSGQAVYTYEITENLANYITNLYMKNIDEEPVTNNEIPYNYASSVSLMNDRLGSTDTDINGGNIRYYGSSPNNYIYFNCSDYSSQNSTNCEKWRIIGVFDNKVKIIKSTSIGTYPWNSYAWFADWANGSLNEILNEGDYFTQLQTKNAQTITVIDDTTYYFGSQGMYSGEYSNYIYKKERGSEDVYETSWDGKIALMYASDYGYAADFAKGCSVVLSEYSNTACTSTNWLYSAQDEWLLDESDNYPYAWAIYSDGMVESDAYGYGWGDEGVQYSYSNVRPTLYLNSDVVINNVGDGSSEKPYQLVVS